MSENYEVKDKVVDKSGTRLGFDWSVKVFLLANGNYYGVSEVKGKRMSTLEASTLDEAFHWACNLLANEYSEIELVGV